MELLKKKQHYQFYLIYYKAKNSKVKITATDLDIIYFEEIVSQTIKKKVQQQHHLIFYMIY